MELEFSLLFMEGAGKLEYPTDRTENLRAMKSITEQLYKINPRLTPRPRFINTSYISLIKANIACRAGVFFLASARGARKLGARKGAKKRGGRGPQLFFPLQRSPTPSYLVLLFLATQALRVQQAWRNAGWG